MNSRGEMATPQLQQPSAARQIVYAAHAQSIGTYLVDPSSGNITQAGADVTIEDAASPGAGPLNVTASPNGQFLYVNLSDANGDDQLGVFATNAQGIPQLPAVQTVHFAPFAQFSLDPNGKWAYSLVPSIDQNTQLGSAVVHQWLVDPATGKLSDTGKQVSDPPAAFSTYGIAGTVLGGSVLLSSATYSMDGFSSLEHLGHALDAQTGAPSSPARFYAVGWEWGDFDRTALSSLYIANFFNGLEERIPSMTYIDVISTQNTAAAPIHCTSSMTDACLNAGDIQFDSSGNFLFVSDVINHRIRVLQIDANNKLLRDTGSTIPFTGQLFFSPDDSLVFAIPDTDTHVHVFSFNQTTGSLIPKGSPSELPTPFVLVPSMRK